MPDDVKVGSARLESEPAKTESGEPIRNSEGKQVYRWRICATVTNPTDAPVTGTVELGVVWRATPPVQNRYDELCKAEVTVPARKKVARGESPGSKEVCCSLASGKVSDIKNFGGELLQYFSPK